MATGVTWQAGQWRELVDGRVVRLVRALGDGLWIVDGGYEREQVSRLLGEAEANDWASLMTPSERGETLFAASDLPSPVTS